MSEKQKTTADQKAAVAEERKPIEHWRDALGTDKTLFVGLLSAYGWAEGYECTQKEYEKAVNGFLKKPVRPAKKGR
ncbi:hypothetical protein KDJ56_11135 [Brevibacillus composti]|uniref:Uncharacterized protein n=1 Tax=Brevibacillus composti TaxID=2796470 RepID=A0ABX7Z9M8_9BACL|nr:hypothetical protein [Brevibacillus composti]QUO43454.1 hypothetical protein KDJ56_11135 [Brevibacillus composti]